MSGRSVHLMECTLRDGSYAVDFKFTAADTALLASQLDRLGFQWIEIGHGQGLGASRQHSKSMPATDAELIQAARTVSNRARLGMFFIPGLGEVADLVQARDNGLDFIRIGHDVTMAEAAFPWVEQCAAMGFRVFVNLMKSYAVPAEVFGKTAAMAAGTGAEAVYLVDSAGHMSPGDVGEYIAAARSRTKAALGFHGHDNLRLAVANCLAAFEHGAEFLDCTMFGIGRDAGNPPSEVLVALFDKPEACCGIDLFEILDMAEHYVRPLANNLQIYDMLSVAMGYAGFHSSYLPEVLEIARRRRADPKRMVMEAGRHSPIGLDKRFLTKVAEKHRDSVRIPDSNALVDAPDSQAEFASLDALLECMARIISKRPGSAAAMLFTPAREETSGLFRGSVILSSSSVTLGRVTYGTRIVLGDALPAVAGRVAMSIMDRASDAAPWSRGVYEWAKTVVPESILAETDVDRLVDAFLIDVMESLRETQPGRLLLLTEPGRHEGVWRSIPPDRRDVILVRPGERPPLEYKPYSACLCLRDSATEDEQTILPLLSESGKIHIPTDCLRASASPRVIPVDIGMAFHGLLERLTASRVAAAGGSLAKQRDAWRIEKEWL